MKKALAILILLSVLCVSSPSLAIDSQNKFMTIGLGSATCGEYIKGSELEKPLYHNWMLGYFTGVNRYKRGLVDYTRGVKPVSLELWIENYCKGNPLADFSEAADLLLEETSKK